jgi:hypothetical protein
LIVFRELKDKNITTTERQILREIFGPIHCKERWRIRSNNKLRKLIQEEDTVKYMKAQRIR